MGDDEQRFVENGFEFAGTFYRWHVSDQGKDLMLIDRFSGLPIDEFFELVDDDHEQRRAPILLSLIACSIRNAHPDWSVERIVRVVMKLELSALTFIAGDEEDDESDGASPLAVHDVSTLPTLDERSRSTRSDSSLSSTDQDDSDSPTSFATPA